MVSVAIAVPNGSDGEWEGRSEMKQRSFNWRKRKERLTLFISVNMLDAEIFSPFFVLNFLTGI